MGTWQFGKQEVSCIFEEEEILFSRLSNFSLDDPLTEMMGKNNFVYESYEGIDEEGFYQYILGII